MSKHMMILNSSDKEKIEQLIQEDLITYCDNVMVMVEEVANHEIIRNMSQLILDDLTSVNLNEIGTYLTKVINGVSQNQLDQVKTELLLCKNFVNDIEVIYT
ncbi:MULTISPECIES: hypothetical protein [unclassified Fusibacter]|uniref:hypothetical protein n=1 Tax=unclassified Fusibacter TaxID=2624464 RepID=UPI001010B5E7|nr:MULTISPECIES: hypothetical protein [unclassified Fusibacter]MCK8060311.1 hypothetical protein [Fusibacter sp. A2]NPE20400.1 hypothetical protein [Fusibacter sp. A1]RXV63605.1 hypothetical protein DWB64_01115 [Fusibacter sp. A1]